MGPRPFSRGNPWWPRRAISITQMASMGPRPFSRGNHHGRQAVCVPLPASMGPRPFSRGNAPRWPRSAARRPSFNGATAFQPWKCGSRRPACRCRRWLQWGHGLSAVEMRKSFRCPSGRIRCFNGATAFQPWKFGYENVAKWADLELQWGHGLSAVEIAWTSTLLTDGTLLQWGHGLSAVEIARLLWAAICAPPASMGPRPFSRGNPQLERLAVPGVAASMGPRPFSRGNPVAALQTAAGLIRFNGATAFQPWKFESGRRRAAFPTGFNGATAFQPWKYLAGFTDRASDQVLQWGHGLSAVEMLHSTGSKAEDSLASMGPRPFSRGNGGFGRFAVELK